MLEELPPVLPAHERQERVPDEMRPLAFEQMTGRQVDLQDHPGRIEERVGDRREIEQICVISPGELDSILIGAQRAELAGQFVVRVLQPNPMPAPLLSSFLGSTRYENLDSAVRLRGLEYELSTHPLPGTELRVAHAIIDRNSSHPGIEDRSAPYTAALSWIQDWGSGWKSMISILRMGPLAGGDGYVPRYRFVAKPYTTADANITYTTKVGGHAVQLGLTAQNLGERHQEFADRSQQAASGSNDPVNKVCPTAYLSLSIALERGKHP